MKTDILKKCLIGITAGFVTGFLGTGGGILLLPAFIYILKIDPTEARATSVCCIFAMASAGSFLYYKNNSIDWKIAVLCAIGGTIGGYIGAKFLGKIPDYILRIAFVCLLLFISITSLKASG